MPQSVVGNKTEAQSDSERILEEKIGLKLEGLTLPKSFPPLLGRGWDGESECRFSAETAGQKQMTMLNLDKNSDQWAWCQDRILVVEKYLRFLWSVTTSTGKVEPSR